MLSLSMKFKTLSHKSALSIKYFNHQIQYSERTVKKMTRSRWIYLEVSKDVYQYPLSYAIREILQQFLLK